MSRGDGQALAEQKMRDKKAASSPGMELDPATIAMILMLIEKVLIPMVQQCFAPKPPTPTMLRQRRFLTTRIAAAIRRQSYLDPQVSEMPWFEARREAKELVELIEESSDEDLALFIADCCDEPASEPASTGSG